MASMLTCYAEKNAPATPSSLIKLKNTILHRPKWNEDTNRSSPAGLLHIYIGSNLFLIERETVHDIRWMSVLHRPEQSGDLERSSPAGLVYIQKVSF